MMKARTLGIVCASILGLSACGEPGNDSSAPAPLVPQTGEGATTGSLDNGIHPMNQRALDEQQKGGVKEGAALHEEKGLLAGGIISNGVIQLGVNQTASLNVPGGELSTGAAGTTTVGLRYQPTGGEATAPGCLCEGWGVADGLTGVTGWANEAQGGSFNLSVENFSADGSEATSVVRVGSTFRVTHHFKPSPKTAKLYEVEVTIENISGSTIGDLRYTRAMDWDISPNTFDEFVTIRGTASATMLRYADDNGFSSTDPLGPRSALLGSGDFEDLGPADHGALFDFQFGELAAGKTHKFKIFYGAAGNEADALSALGSVEAEAYSLGQSSWDGTGDYRDSGGAPHGAYGAATGEPHTFIFAFGDIGGTPIINAPPIANAGPDQSLQCLLPGSTHTVTLDGSGSHDPNGSALTFDWYNGPSVVSNHPAPSLALALGSYTFSLVVNDGTLASAPDTVSIELKADTEPPSLALNGAPSLGLECGRDSYSEPGAGATDACFGDLSSQVKVTGEVNTGAPGSYTVSYSVSDPAGHSATASRDVRVSDTLAPALALNGASSLGMECGRDSYAEPGATATDVCFGDLSSQVKVTGEVNTGAPGSYTVSYSVVDGVGNSASQARTVGVSDTLAPSQTLVGSPTQTLECAVDRYVEQGTRATDVCAGDLSARVAVSGSVNTGATGTYSVSYTVSDPSGNTALPLLRAVSVQDTLAPGLALLGEPSMTLECGVESYVEPGATAHDVCTGDLSGSIAINSSAVDTGSEGTYSVAYQVADVYGNTASATRGVSVEDTLPPTLSLLGSPTVTLECGAGSYVEPGATASDACHGELTGAIAISGSVDANTSGTYPVSYSVVDGSGHSATQVRTVKVQDTAAPEVLVKPTVQLWSPNHKMESFRLSDCAAITEQCDASAGIDQKGTITSIFSDEPEDAKGNGDGHTLDDIVITGQSSFELRAERAGGNNGRVYGVNFKVSDAAGNETRSTCYFGVPHDMSGSEPINDGPEAGYTVEAAGSTVSVR